MTISAILGFAAIAAALIAVPGPDWAFVLAAGTRDHVVLPAVAGLVAGYALITAVVVIGVGPLLAALPSALSALTILGSGYLIFLGIRTLRSSAPLSSDATALASSPGRCFARGVGVSGLNPKGLLIFVSILPQFARPDGPWPLPAQLAVLGATFMLITAVFYLPLGLAADRVLGARPQVARISTKIAGTAMIIVGLALCAERILQVLG